MVRLTHIITSWSATVCIRANKILLFTHRLVSFLMADGKIRTMRLFVCKIWLIPFLMVFKTHW